MKRTRMTKRVREAFLRVLADSCNVSCAARAAGISRNTAYEHRKSDPAFAGAWDEAEQIAADALEAEARRRGVKGYDRPVIHKGKIVDTYKEYSDRMLELLLKAHRPEKFREKVRNELTGKDGGPIKVAETPASQRLSVILSAIALGADDDGEDH